MRTRTSGRTQGKKGVGKLRFFQWRKLRLKRARLKASALRSSCSRSGAPNCRTLSCPGWDGGCCQHSRPCFCTSEAGEAGIRRGPEPAVHQQCPILNMHPNAWHIPQQVQSRERDGQNPCVRTVPTTAMADN